MADPVEGAPPVRYAYDPVIEPVSLSETRLDQVEAYAPPQSPAFGLGLLFIGGLAAIALMRRKKG